MKSPHVLFMARRFPPSVGGMERFAFDLSTVLQKNTKLSLVTWGKRTRSSIIIGLPYIFMRSFWNLLTQPSIDIIHCQDGVTSPLAWLLGRLFRTPYVVIVHGLDLTYKNKFYQAVNIWFIRRADRVVAISDSTRDEALIRGIPANKITVIPLGITDFISLEKKPKRELLAAIGYEKLADTQIIFTVARLVKRKGVAWFINEVLPGLYKNNPNIRYVVVGEGIDRPSVEAAIKKQKLGDVVFLLGRAEDIVKHTFFLVSDVFVMPNIPVEGDVEGFGIVAQEAAVAGLPIVASKLEGIVNAIQDRKNGWLVPPRNVEAYEKAIVELLANSDKRHSLGTQARRYTLEHFGWPTIAKQYMAMYETMSPHASRRNTKAIVSVIIIAVTTFLFVVYATQNHEVTTSLLHSQPITLVQLIGLYFCQFGSLLAVLYFSVRFYHKKISLHDNFLISSYSSLTNFFGPTQAGSGVRALYLRAKLAIKIKDFIFVSLLYYAIYATLSMAILLAGAGRWQWSIVAAAVVALFSLLVVRWYKKRSHLRQHTFHPFALLGITTATVAQLFCQSLIYFIEILNVNPHATYAQALSFTGAANFSLFVSLTPGAIGVREAFLLFSQNLHHLNNTVIVAAGVLDRAIYVVFLGMIFLIIIALHGHKKIQKLRASE